MMKISYNPLWKTLIDRKMTKSALRDSARLSKATITRMGKDEPVGLAIVLRICEALNCAVYDVVEVIEAPEKEQ